MFQEDVNGSIVNGSIESLTILLDVAIKLVFDFLSHRRPTDYKEADCPQPLPLAGPKVQKPSNRGLSEEKLVYLPPKGFLNRRCRFFELKKRHFGAVPGHNLQSTLDSYSCSKPNRRDHHSICPLLF